MNSSITLRGVMLGLCLYAAQLPRFAENLLIVNGTYVTAERKEELGKATLPVSRRKDATEDMAAAGMKVRIVVIPDQETAGPRSESVRFKES